MKRKEFVNECQYCRIMDKRGVSQFEIGQMAIRRIEKRNKHEE